MGTPAGFGSNQIHVAQLRNRVTFVTINQLDGFK